MNKNRSIFLQRHNWLSYGILHNYIRSYKVRPIRTDCDAYSKRFMPRGLGRTKSCSPNL